MALWGWLLLLAYLPLAGLQAVWLGSVIDLMQRRETRRGRSRTPSGRRRLPRPDAGGTVEAGTGAQPPGDVPS